MLHQLKKAEWWLEVQPCVFVWESKNISSVRSFKNFGNGTRVAGLGIQGRTHANHYTHSTFMCCFWHSTGRSPQSWGPRCATTRRIVMPSCHVASGRANLRARHLTLSSWTKKRNCGRSFATLRKHSYSAAVIALLATHRQELSQETSQLPKSQSSILHNEPNNTNPNRNENSLSLRPFQGAPSYQSSITYSS